MSACNVPPCVADSQGRCRLWGVPPVTLNPDIAADPLPADPSATINTTRKATVAYPSVKRLLFHMFYPTHPQKLMESHEMV